VIARTAAALCVANRWLAAASLVLTAAVLVRAEGSMVLSAMIAAGAMQVYLAFRIELDRAIFEAIASEAGTFERFDAAAAAIGLSRRPAGRSPEARAKGLWSLVKCSGLVLGLQLALAIAAIWVPG